MKRLKLLIATTAMTLGVTTVPAAAVPAAALRSQSQVELAEDAFDRGGRMTRHAQDVKLTFGWDVYVNLWGTEVKAIASALIAAGGAAVIVGCSGIGRLPNVVGALVALLCTMTGGTTVFAIAKGIINLWKSDRYINSDWCYQRTLSGEWYAPWVVVSAENCS